MWQDLKNIYHLLVALLANIYYGFPSRKFTVIGVTGTDGKTTTTSLIYHILQASGKKALMISSVGAVIDGKEYDVGFHVTTPSSFALQKFLKQASDAGLKYLVLETTSHALDQYRVFGIHFNVGVLTNITHEHLDYHKTYGEYVNTKLKLLVASDTAIVNRDDGSYAFVSKVSKLKTYGLKKNADINPYNFPFTTTLFGEFNKYNILAAVSVCKALGVEDSKIRSGIKSFKPPKGREDIVYKNSFSVMIDFAHTPNAFEVVLRDLRRANVKGRIIHVFGSAGARDATKRPLMGKTSAKYADILILTAEDPRKEPIEKIVNEIASGVTDAKKVLKIYDRKKAISEAIKMARKEDFVLITGKSHEKSMNYGYGEELWDEYKVVKDALKQFNNSAI
ncbi:MAG: UDP-N-acetylmuramyl-tripeptide synthetase [Patescibacteria group bacterium]